jgi:hypothetical protein
VKLRTLIFLLFALATALTSCRMVIPAGEIRAGSAPDISRITLKNGSVVEFDQDFGWYNKKSRIVEGKTKTGDQVEYHISEIAKVEYVRVYSIFFAAGVATVAGGLAIYILARLFALL